MFDKDVRCQLGTIPIKIEEDQPQDDTNSLEIKRRYTNNFIAKIWENIGCEKQFAPLEQLNFPGDERIDFSKMKEKSYDDFDQLEDDIRQFDLDCRETQKQAIRKASKELIEYVNEQIELIKACQKCYENSFEFGIASVKLTCSKPHLLLWVKVHGYSGYWPAKVMIVNAQKNTVHVRFFGDCTKITLSATECFLYSKEPPIRKCDHQKSYQTAVQEAKEYIEGMRLVFPIHFNYAKPSVAFDPTKFTDYLKQMTASQDELNAIANPSYEFNEHTEDTGLNIQDDDINSNSSTMDANHTNVGTEMSTANGKKNQNTTRKRSTRTFSVGCQGSKKFRGEIDYGKVMQAMHNSHAQFAQTMQMITQLNDDNVAQVNKLKMELTNAKGEINVANAKMAKEKEAFAREIGGLKQLRFDDMQMFEKEKGALMKRNAELGAELAEARKMYDDSKRASESIWKIYQETTDQFKGYWNLQ